jgi:hypothetical protein
MLRCVADGDSRRPPLRARSAPSSVRPGGFSKIGVDATTRCLNLLSVWLSSATVEITPGTKLSDPREEVTAR